ncbi:glycosyltransferase family 2 protein [Geomonas azotofigens]|uniref:glycosyltransferase family 2 protein n=1 Tax=Geomonas azotofigens TaxID=2843196 RepID=UPI001C0FE0ED|nr:glycosyltransferase family 2 protein [Geomonas azotofigens]MBU5612486.1 glycosyltransferase family 2 protein [Geomonas azotofigens]
MTTRLAIVMPCYNEEEVLPESGRRLVELLNRLQNDNVIAAGSLICFVDDGSTDQTWEIIQSLALTESRVCGIKLSCNRGHQSALLAGVLTVEGDAIVTIDADLQDDVNAIEEMVRRFQQGFDIVYGVRRSRATDTTFKRSSAQAYYKLLRLMGAKVVYGHADFRLLGRRAVESLREYSEVNLFLRGIVPQLGFPATAVYYDRVKRFAGVSKYPLRRMLGLAIDGITSFSIMPLRLISALGIVVCSLSIAMVVWVTYGHFVLNSTIPGWASSVIPIYFLGGIQMLSIGVVGEYVAKVYLETKRRPRYFIEQTVRAASTEVGQHGRIFEQQDGDGSSAIEERITPLP